MSEPDERAALEAQKQGYALQRIREQSDLRRTEAVERIEAQAKLRERGQISAAEFDAEVEQLRGENERKALRLMHDLGVERLNVDLQYQEKANEQHARLEGILTRIRQHDDQVRFFWELDREVVQLESRLIEKRLEAEIKKDQTRIEQDHEVRMEKQKRKTMSHENELDKDNFEFKERLVRELSREFGGYAEADISAAYDRLKASNKI